jgi:hypothetical protein
MLSLKLNKIMIMRRIILVLFLGLFCFAVKAQISTKEIPFSWENAISRSASIPEVIMANLDMEKLQEEELGVPSRFGFLHSVDITTNCKTTKNYYICRQIKHTF